MDEKKELDEVLEVTEYILDVEDSKHPGRYKMYVSEGLTSGIVVIHFKRIVDVEETI